MKKILNWTLIGLAILVSSCTSDGGGARLNVRLTDAPADYEELLIDVKDVKINVSSGDQGSWQSLTSVKRGVYNLLDFTNGLDTMLVDEVLPVGTIAQMRLVLGSDNKVKINGEYHDLETPSAQQSGLKFNIHAELTEGVIYKLWIDFDAGRSVVEKGNGKYSLKPVIRTFTEATSGAIKGMVKPTEAKPYVMAISAAQDTLGTYADVETGYFLIRGVDAGDYRLVLEPAEPYRKKELSELVNVSIGKVTELPEIVLE